MYLQEIRLKVVDRVHLAQDGDDFYEHGNEHSGSMKCGDFFNYLKFCCFLERYIIQDKTINLFYSN
jgi:hypothetical protein